MKILIACEFSGIVRDAFRARGHDAVSCDLLPSERPGPHIQGDVLKILKDGWDLMVAHPPCTHLSSSGARWWKDKILEQSEALDFVRRLLEAPIRRIAIENPVGRLGTVIGQPAQVVHPWEFGHGETKTTCLWLHGLMPLWPTEIVKGRKAAVHTAPPSPDRWKFRSRTYPGIARAMAEQWA